uniref:Methyltransferase n=1 Tax=Candidatus Kentrum sp. FM TaxID=2126340 RepID=A0A450TUE0_9GAMM|nr:MAG: site-specific DNA-methyltransferase (adenine-specific) [Candidatus Kentron sp. FM]VFJ72846.1 MAG: site-specific DNA-methyltransferase (adenine-specific) [Candidatus Kentron sp. FM]VFK20058.1 MAG: site-specific DNA-methyltransferase (adenine-specific) [Candidatus Kentron sp. FM]
MAKILKYQKTRETPLRVENAVGALSVELGDALEKYEHWPSPTAIVSDGPYGLAKFPGDPQSEESLGEWYAPHMAAWSKKALPETTLWFWCSEVGWAEVHPVLKLHGWRYKAGHIWDKGIGHVAGNCNGDTIRGFPVVSEICVQYVRDVQFRDSDGHPCSMKSWLRGEWLRSGLPLTKTNEACGVRNAATRKYFTQCHLWYFPPPEKMEELARYANLHGCKTDKPYFSLDGKTPLTASQWFKMRPKWNHVHGVTNVWQEPAVRGRERIRRKGLKSLHANQKPLKLMERIIESSTDAGDVVWEPFGGLCSATVAALRIGRSCYAAEVLPEYFDVAVERIDRERRENVIYEQKPNAKAS